MKHTRRWLLSLLVIGSLLPSASSCLEPIDLDTGERVLNVYCVLGQGPGQSLELTYIAPVGGSACPVEEEATVTLYDEGAPVGQFMQVSETKWTIDYTPHAGHLYRLEVKVVGENPLTAETRYPPVSSLQQVSLAFSDPNASRELGGNTGFKLDSTEDQILWCYYENLEEGPAFAQYLVTDHPGVDGRGETIYPFDRDSPVIEAEFKTGKRIDGWPEGFYHSTTGIYSPLFYGEPAFLHERVLRIVHPAGFHRSISQNQFRVYTFDESGVHFEEGKTSGVFGIAGVNRTFMKAQLVICSVSGEYDRYLQDYYYGNRQGDDFATLVYKRNHYSNIQGGTGIFGASQMYRKEYFDLFSIFDNTLYDNTLYESMPDYL